jgi:hypothetical protein
MPPVGFESTIPASARPQTYALDRAATGIGISLNLDQICHYLYTRLIPGNVKYLQPMTVVMLQRYSSITGVYVPGTKGLTSVSLPVLPGDTRDHTLPTFANVSHTKPVKIQRKVFPIFYCLSVGLAWVSEEATPLICPLLIPRIINEFGVLEDRQWREKTNHPGNNSCPTALRLPQITHKLLGTEPRPPPSEAGD